MKVLSFAALSGILFMGCLDDSTGKPAMAEQAFGMDTGTVFLAGFNGKAVNDVTGDTGSVKLVSYPDAVFGKGLRMETDSGGKALCLFRNSAPLSLATGTLEALVRSDSAASGFNHILDKSWQYGISNHNGFLAVHFGGGLDGWWYPTVPLPKGKWTYLAVAFDGATLSLYVNGALAASTPNTGGLGSTAYDVGIGNASDPGFDIPFMGIIDEMRLSKVVRTGAEITKAWKGMEKKIAGR